MVPCASHSNFARFARNCLLFAIDANPGAGGTPAGRDGATWWQTEHTRWARFRPRSRLAANAEEVQTTSTAAMTITERRRQMALHIVISLPNRWLCARAHCVWNRLARPSRDIDIRFASYLQPIETTLRCVNRQASGAPNEMARNKMTTFAKSPSQARRCVLRGAALVLLSFMMMSSSPAQVATPGNPFTVLHGSWGGTGTIAMSSGTKERIRCPATYRLENTENLRLELGCASDSYRFELRSQITYDDQTISGSWNEATRGVGGNITGRAGGGRIQARAEGQTFTALLDMTTRGTSKRSRSNRQGARCRGNDRAHARTRAPMSVVPKRCRRDVASAGALAQGQSHESRTSPGQQDQLRTAGVRRGRIMDDRAFRDARTPRR